jgi:hypothetical protein
MQAKPKQILISKVILVHAIGPAKVIRMRSYRGDRCRANRDALIGGRLLVFAWQLPRP